MYKIERRLYLAEIVPRYIIDDKTFLVICDQKNKQTGIRAGVYVLQGLMMLRGNAVFPMRLSGREQAI